MYACVVGRYILARPQKSCDESIYISRRQKLSPVLNVFCDPWVVKDGIVVLMRSLEMVYYDAIWRSREELGVRSDCFWGLMFFMKCLFSCSKKRFRIWGSGCELTGSARRGRDLDFG